MVPEIYPRAPLQAMSRRKSEGPPQQSDETTLKTPDFYSTDLYTERIEQIVSSHNSSKPLFLYAALQNVHFPLEVPESYLSEFRKRTRQLVILKIILIYLVFIYSWIKDKKRRTYAAMVRAMDYSIGRIINTFEKRVLFAFNLNFTHNSTLN